MRFATIRDTGGPSAAVVRGDEVCLFEPGVTVLDLVRGGLPAALAAGERAIRTGRRRSVCETDFEAPLAPPTIRDFVTFAEHVEGVRASAGGPASVPEAWYDAPVFYFSNPYTVTGPHTVIRPPAASVAVDFEMEVAAVIGRAGKDIPVREAADHIFGYTIFNDWTARDLQAREMEVGLGPAKGKDFANTIGPVLVTADEFTDRIDDDGFLTLSCRAYVNNVLVGEDVLSNMGWTFAALVSYASRDSMVQPGDLLGSGTTGNGGCLAELWGRAGRREPKPLEFGDVVRLVVDGIGALTVVVGERSDAAEPLPGHRGGDPARNRANRAGAPVAVRP